MKLPTFKYHPAPVATGSVVESDKVCICCVEKRGYIYTGPVYCEDELDERFCPWCIANGSAHEEYEAKFTDIAGIGGYGDWDSVSEAVKEEVAYRTPGFTGWQQGRWFTHCRDAAEFLGLVGHAQAVKAGPEFVQCLRKDVDVMPESDWEYYFHALDADGSPTAYLFRCRHCGKYGGYSDCD